MIWGLYKKDPFKNEQSVLHKKQGVYADVEEGLAVPPPLECACDLNNIGIILLRTIGLL